MHIIFRKSLPAVHEAISFQPFPFPLVDNDCNIIIEVFNNIIISNIYHNICNCLGHSQHTHIRFSVILDLRELYHHKKILLYGSKIEFPPHINNLSLKYPSDNMFGPIFIKTGLIFYIENHILLSMVLMSDSTFYVTFLC